VACRLATLATWVAGGNSCFDHRRLVACANGVWLHHAFEPSSSNDGYYAILPSTKRTRPKAHQAAQLPRVEYYLPLHSRLGCAPIWSAALYIHSVQLLNSLILETTIGRMPAELGLAILHFARCGGAEKKLLQMLPTWSTKKCRAGQGTSHDPPPPPRHTRASDAAGMVRVEKGGTHLRGEFRVTLATFTLSASERKCRSFTSHSSPAPKTHRCLPVALHGEVLIHSFSEHLVPSPCCR
jgi:hypothetical protein